LKGPGTREGRHQRINNDGEPDISHHLVPGLFTAFVSNAPLL